MLNRIKGLFCREVPVALPVAKLLVQCCNCGKEHCRQQWDEINGTTYKATCSGRCDEELNRWMDEQEALAAKAQQVCEEYEEREEVKMEREEWIAAFNAMGVEMKEAYGIPVVLKYCPACGGSNDPRGFQNGICSACVQDEVEYQQEKVFALDLPMIESSGSEVLSFKCSKVMALVGR